jgi:hypothetical protein
MKKLSSLLAESYETIAISGKFDAYAIGDSRKIPLENRINDYRDYWRTTASNSAPLLKTTGALSYILQTKQAFARPRRRRARNQGGIECR